MKQKIVIRADGGTSIGMGHIIRCIALADMLKNDFTIVFAIQQPIESVIKNIHSVSQTILHLPFTNDYHQDSINFVQFIESTDIVILDGYNFQTDYQQAIKNKGCKLVVIDDLHNWHHVADAIINHAAGIRENEYDKETYTKLFLGLNYALLRKKFLEQSTPARKIAAIKKVFISMGAVDITNLTLKFTDAIVAIKEIEEIHLMLGSINPNIHLIDSLIQKNKHINIIKHFEIGADQLFELLKTCDVAICPASSISIECSAVGIGLIAGFTADNQKGILNGLERHKMLINLGDFNKMSSDEIRTKFESLSKQPAQFNMQIENQKKMIDGKSPERILALFQNLIY